MTRYLLYGLLTALACAAWAATTDRDPYLGYVYPAGGQQGATAQVVMGGQRLRGAADAVVSGTGVRVTVLDYIGPGGPLNKQQQDLLRERVQAIVKQRFPGAGGKTPPPAKKNEPAANGKKPVTLPDLPELRDLETKTPMQLRELIDKYANPKKQPKPPMAEEVILEVAIDPNAAPGDREIRLRTPAGLSNPLIFMVGSQPEQSEPSRVEKELVAEVTAVPVTLNGQIMPGQVDRYPLRLAAGQRLTATAHARKLIPYLADAVPGWFQAVLALTDAEGREVAFADDDQFNPDPILTYATPRDGVYTLEIRDAIYRGRQDFVYRIEVTDQPPATRATALPTLEDLLPLGAALPRDGEAEPNDTGQQTRPQTLPRVIHGSIAQTGDVDVYQFKGRAGEEVVVEVYARRLGSPMDALARLIDHNGKVVAWNDDSDDKGMGLLTHHADSYLAATLPATGAYFVQVSDVQRHGGAEYTYAVRISPRMPDFALRVTPASINVTGGLAAAVTVTALRKDGWDDEIVVSLKDAPKGFVLHGARIPAGRESVRMTLTTPTVAGRQKIEPVNLLLEGRARVGAVEITRPVVPAERQMQAFAYYHLVPSQQLEVMVGRGARVTPAIAVAATAPVRIPVGGRAEVACTIKPMPPMALRFELDNPPAGITLEEAQVGTEGVTLVLRAAENAAMYADNLIVQVYTEFEVKRPDGESRKQRVNVGVLPAILCEIVAR